MPNRTVGSGMVSTMLYSPTLTIALAFVFIVQSYRIKMEGDRYILKERAAGSDPLAIQLYSEQNMDANAKSHLTKLLTQVFSQDKKVSVLILGARGGLTAQIMMPYCEVLDLVEEEPYAELLEARFVKGKEVEYTFGKEGFIGDKCIVPKPALGTAKLRVLKGSSFSHSALTYYDVVLLQNTIITPSLNLVSELIQINHGILLTALVPGYIITKPFFPFIVRLEKHVLREYYESIFHEQVQSKKFITGRRNEIFYMEVFGWKRADASEDSKSKIAEVLGEGEKELSGIWQEKKAEHSNPYEAQQMVDTYLNFHYGEDNFGVENFPAHCGKICIEKAKKEGVKGRALDLGCAVGRTSIELADYFEEVIGLDFSGAFVKAAIEAAANNYEQINHKIKFVEGDACNLKPQLGIFNLIFGGNLIDRLPDPAAFLRSVGNFLEKGGLLILTSPYSWLEEYTPQKLWVGGYIENGKPVTTNEGLKKILGSVGFRELCPVQDVLFSIKDNEWVYQYTHAWATFWIKDV